MANNRLAVVGQASEAAGVALVATEWMGRIVALSAAAVTLD